MYSDFEQIIHAHCQNFGGQAQFVEKNIDKISSVILASYEVRNRANDDHLNPEAVLFALSRAMFDNEPISLQTIRCLRWCYPNKELEITPTAGDWPTFSKDGQPIERKEWVDREKLNLYKQAVIDPIRYHNIPIKEVVLLATGDYDLVGPGYDLKTDDTQSINARNYVGDIRSRLKKWGVFDDLPVRVVSFRELMSQPGNEDFEGILAEVTKQYDQIFTDHRKNYLGYNSQQAERFIDAEHNSRTPFISGWTRERSRQLTRHKTTMELSLGVLIARQNKVYPTIVTVSGTAPAAQTFSKGHLIETGVPQLGLTLFKSINDGDQPDYYKEASSVV
jgi:hypothetical protein